MLEVEKIFNDHLIECLLEFLKKNAILCPNQQTEDVIIQPAQPKPKWTIPSGYHPKKGNITDIDGVTCCLG